MRCTGAELEQLDATLASLARGEGALRLHLGQALEVLGRGGVFELGFSSLGAYAVERCERSVRWAEGARCLARRLEALPLLREAIALGRISWSMAEVLARVATPADERRWLELAESRTVRQVRLLVAGDRANGDRSNGAQRISPAVASVYARVAGAPGLASRSVDNDADGKGASELASRSVDNDADADGAPELASHSVEKDAEADGAPELASHSVEKDADRKGAPGPAARSVANDADGEGEVGPAVRSVANDAEAEGAAANRRTTLTCTVNREDAWLFEATRCLLDQLGARTSDEQSEALLAEARVTLEPLLLDAPAPANDEGERQRLQRSWECQLAEWRARAEEMCEPRLLVRLSARRAGGRGEASCAGDGAAAAAVAAAAACGLVSFEGARCEAIDTQVRVVSRLLARRELELSVLSLMFHRADGWRRLGYATEAQYARERLGSSPSLLLARRTLGLRLEKLPGVAAALGAGEIGVEAALQIARVATAKTEALWVARAGCRTIKHLREEVAAASTAVRWSGELDCPPPEDVEIEAFQRLEQAVVSGRMGVAANESGGVGRTASGTPASGSTSGSDLQGASAGRRAWFVMLASLASWLGSSLGSLLGAELQTSAAGAPVPAAGGGVPSPRRVLAAGRVTLRLRMSLENAAAWRELETRARRWLPRGVSWLRFVCSCFWHAWQHLLGAPIAYGHIYIRDRFRCMSPVCPRRDVTPHHLQFRSAGGGEEDENIGSLCLWCHLEGIHGGRIRARGPASHIYWELGSRRSPCIVVDGRERIAA